MIQFNLLPDVKLEYIKARRSKHLVMLISFIVTGISIALVVILFVGVNVLQRKHLDNLDHDIKEKTQQLSGEQDINKILTVQNQLNTLNGLHDAKPAIERLGPYLAQITPAGVFISSLKVDYAANTMSFDGGAGSVKSVNTFIDTMKFTTYGSEGKNAFSNVVLTSLDRSDKDQGDAPPAKYQITLAFDPGIFDIKLTAPDPKEPIKLNVPEQVTTRSVTEKPSPLFQPQERGQ
jgi:hypothetical protein